MDNIDAGLWSPSLSCRARQPTTAITSTGPNPEKYEPSASAGLSMTPRGRQFRRWRFRVPSILVGAGSNSHADKALRARMALIGP
jgi:hypothetical protein